MVSLTSSWNTACNIQGLIHGIGRGVPNTTDDNPADLPTLGVPADSYLENQLWRAGPTWLWHKLQWPTWEYNQSSVQTTPEDTDDTPKQTTTVSSL